VSQDITLLDQHGSGVLLGNILMLPVGNAVIYVRPLYVESTTNPLPQLTDVITVLGADVKIEPTVSASLNALLKIQVPTGTPGGSTSPTSNIGSATEAEVNSLIMQAQADYQAAQAALTSGSLAQYQSEIAAMEQVLQQAESLLNPTGTSPTTSPTTTTTTVPKKKTKTTTKNTSTAIGVGGPNSRS
jgi:uncharacterized membrane protein (UPF0182 family)